MRKLLVAAAVAAASFSPVAFADEEAKISTATTTIGTIMDNEAAKAVFEAVVPDIATNPDLAQAYDMTLVDIAGFAPDMLTPEIMKELDEKFAEIK